MYRTDDLKCGTEFVETADQVKGWLYDLGTTASGELGFSTFLLSRLRPRSLLYKGVLGLAEGNSFLFWGLLILCTPTLFNVLVRFMSAYLVS